MDTSKLIEQVVNFLTDELQEELADRFMKHKDHLVLDFLRLATYNPDLANRLLDHPAETLKLFQIAATKMEGCKTEKFRFRIMNLPKAETLPVGRVRTKMIGKFKTINGIVRQKGDVKFQLVMLKFECPSCGSVTPILQTTDKIKKPKICKACGYKSGNWRELPRTSGQELIDAYKLLIEEDPEYVNQSKLANIHVLCETDLTDQTVYNRFGAGSKVRITGWVNTFEGDKTAIDHYFYANHIDVIGDSFEEINYSLEEKEEIISWVKQQDNPVHAMRDKIFPAVYGFDKEKEGIILQMFGGCQKTVNMSRARGDIHILLVGEPGTSKSQLLKIVNGIMPKSRYTAGTGVSGVGLTAAVVKDELLGGWVLEPGVLPLTHKGFLCLAEDSTVIEETKGVIAIKDVIPGDKVLGRNGFFPVKKVLNNGVRERIGLLRTKSGLSLKLTPDHLVFDALAEEWVPAEDFVGLHTNSMVELPLKKTFNYPVYESVHTGKKSKVLSGKSVDDNDWYALGVCVADGYIVKKNTPKRHVSITKKDHEERSRIMNIFKKANIPVKEYVVSNEKHSSRFAIGSVIYADWVKSFFDYPEQLFSAGVSGIKNFLAGLIDCDGWIGEHGSNRSLVISPQNNSVKGRFLRTIMLLLRALGYPAVINKSGYVTFSDTLSVQRFMKEFSPFSKKVSVATVSAAKIAHSSPLEQLPIRYQKNVANAYSSFSKSQSLKDGFHSRIWLAANKKVSKVMYNKIRGYLKNVEPISDSDRKCFFDKAVSFKEEDYDGLVYDLVIDGPPEFYANGILVHNCLDELDKASPEDRNSLHEALEQQSVTISKANISATLQCETTVLAAANPKHGVYDEYQGIFSQIDLAASLINRFDLIFIMKSNQSPEQYKKIINTMMGRWHDGEEQPVKELSPEEILFLKKYVSFAKTLHPIINPDKNEFIFDLFMKIKNARDNSEEKHKFPVSGRQIDALRRLSQAHARANLRLEVSKDDIQAAYDILSHSLQQAGLNPETGSMDINYFSTGGATSSKTLKRERLLSFLMVEQRKKRDDGVKGVPHEELWEHFKDGFESEVEFEKVIEKLKLNGLLYEPKAGYYQTT